MTLSLSFIDESNNSSPSNFLLPTSPTHAPNANHASVPKLPKNLSAPMLRCASSAKMFVPQNDESPPPPDNLNP